MRLFPPYASATEEMFQVQRESARAPAARRNHCYDGMTTGSEGMHLEADALPAQRWLTVMIILFGTLAPWMTLLIVNYIPSVIPAGPGQGVALGKMWMGLTLGGLAGTIGSFFVVDRYPVLCVRLAGLLSAGGLLIAALCESWGGMYPFLVISSAGINVAQIAALAATQVAAPGQTGRLIATYLAVQLGACMVAPLAVSALLPVQVVAQHHADARFTLCLAALGVAFAAVAIGTPGGTRPLKSETINPEAPRLQMAPGKLWLLILFSTLASIHPAVDTALYQWSTKWFTDAFAVHAFPPVWILSGSAAGYCLGRVALALLPEGFWERRLLILPGLTGAGFIWAAVSCSAYVPAAALYECSSAHALEYPVLLGLISRRDACRTL